MTSSDKTSPTDKMNNTDPNRTEPDDGPILEQLDDKRCGICHEIIMKACRVSCGHRFCRYCLDRKRSIEAFKPGESGKTPKCTVCNTAINEVQNLSELDKEIDELYSKLSMKARLDRAALKAQRERQVDAWRRRPIVPPASKSSTATRPTTTSASNSSLPFPSRRRNEYLVTPRRNRGIIPERQRSYLDMYRENVNLPQRQQSSPDFQVLFDSSRSQIHRTMDRLNEMTTRTNLLTEAANRILGRRREPSSAPGPRREPLSPLSHSQTSLNSESPTGVSASASSTSGFRPVLIQETYTIRRTRVLNGSTDTQDTFSPQSEHRTEPNYYNDANTEFQESEYLEEEPQVQDPTNDSAYGSTNNWESPNQRYPQNQSFFPWSTPPTPSANNPPNANSVPYHLNAALPNWYYGVDPAAYPSLNPRPGPTYYSFLPQFFVPPMTPPPPPATHWSHQESMDPFPGCPCQLCHSRRSNLTNSYFDPEPSSYYGSMGGIGSSEELHSSGSTGYVGGGDGYEYPGDMNYSEYDPNDSSPLGNYDLPLFPLTSEESEERAYQDFSQSAFDMNLNYSFEYPESSTEATGSSNYFGSHGGEYDQHDFPESSENNWSNNEPEYQNIVDSFYSSNAAGAAASVTATSPAEEGAAAAAARPQRNEVLGRSTRRRNANGNGQRSHQRFPSSQTRPSAFDRNEFTSRGNGTPSSWNDAPREPASNSRDACDFDEFGPEISVTEAIIGFRR